MRIILRFSVLFSLVLAHIQGMGQCTNFQRLLSEGHIKCTQNDFKGAINKYYAAVTDCPEKGAEVQPAILEIFDRVDSLSKQAENALEEAKIQRIKAEETQKFYERLKVIADSLLIVTQEVLDLAKEGERKAIKLRAIALQELAMKEKLIQALLFYDGKYALGHSMNQYGEVYFFINKSGDRITRLGEWKKAEQFNSRGFATVTSRSELFLLDTIGNRYPLATNLRDLTSEKTALELGLFHFKTIPNRLIENIQLEVLVLRDNSLNRLPSTICKLRCLKFIDLTNNILSTLPAEIGKLPALAHLYLGSNKLVMLPAEIGKLASLKTLVLKNNHLACLPHEIGSLRRLVLLNLAENHLSTVPSSIGNLFHLEILDLHNNWITKLPSEIHKLRSLKHLNLSANQLKTLPPAIAALADLEVLDIRYNPCSDTPIKQDEICATIAEWLPNCQVIF